MATHDYVLANQSGSSFRTDLNNALAAVVSNNSNSSEPSTTYAYMLWVDTTNNLVKLRNSANNAWIILFTTNGGLDVDAASNFNADVTFTGANFNVVWDKSDNSLEFADNAKALFGSSGDLEIYHNGSGSYIENSGTGSLNLYGDEVGILNKARSEWKANFVTDGAVELYFDNSKKLSTSSAGVVVDNGTMRCNDGFSSDTNLILNSDANANGASAIIFQDAGSEKARITGGNIRIANDSGKIQLGAAQDLQIYHSSSNHSYIRNSQGILHIDNYDGDIKIRPADGDTGIVVASNGSVELYFDNSKKLETLTGGVDITGDLTIDGAAGGTLILGGSAAHTSKLVIADNGGTGNGNFLIEGGDGTDYLKISSAGNVRFEDSREAQFGAGSDLRLWHDGSNSYINNTTGILRIRDSEIRLCNTDNETYFMGAANGAAKLYYDDSIKLETKSNGITISGQLSTSTTANTTVPVEINDTSDTATHTHRIKFATGGTEVGRIRSSNSATVYDTSASDRTLKKNFEDWEQDVLNLFKNINPQKFHFIQEEDTAEKSKGFIAQEMVDSFPEAYTKEDKEDSKYYFNPSGMVVYLMKAVQEAITKIETLETKVAALEAK